MTDYNNKIKLHGYSALKVMLCCIAFFAVFSFSKAEDYSDVFWTYVEEDLNTYHSLTSLSTIKSTYMSSLYDYDQTVTESISKFVRFEVSSTQNGNIDGVLYYFCLYDNAVFSLCSSLNTDLTSFNFSMGAYDSARDASLVGDNVDRRFYVLHIKYNSSVSLHNHRTQGSYQANFTLVDVGYSTDLTSYYVTGSFHTFAHLLGDSSITAFSDLTSNNIISYGDNFLTDNDLHVAYYGSSINWVDDDRLQFYTTFSQSGSDLLTTDITEFVNDFPIQDSSHSSIELVDDQITLGVDSDGNITTYVLNSNNSSITSEKYRFITPYSFFDLSGDDVKIVSCTFSLSGSGQGIEPYSETYSISCEYWIKHIHDGIEKGENEYASDVNGEETSQETKDALSYLVTFREGYGLTFEDFGDVVFPDYYTYADVYLYNNQAALNYLIDNVFSVNSVAYIIQNIANDEDEVMTQIGLFLDDSNYGQYYDVIVFDWIQETNSSYTHTYWYFETVSGRTKANVQFLAVIQEDLNALKVNSAAIWKSVDNLESESLEFFNAQLNDNVSIIGWLSTINNSINNLSFPSYDDSGIVLKLDEIIELLTDNTIVNEIDTPQECIDYYLENENTDINDIDIELRPAYYEGATLNFLYGLVEEGSSEVRSRVGSSPSLNILWKFYNMITSVYKNSEAGEQITMVLKDMDNRNEDYSILFDNEIYSPVDWGGEL